MTVCLVGSSGGHLTELLSLREAFAGHEVFVITYASPVTAGCPRTYFLTPIGMSPWRMLRSLWRVVGILRAERPDLIVSTGAELAIPVAYLGRWLCRARVVFVECAAMVTHPSWTGRVLYPVADRFLVQWPSLLRAYGPKARCAGGIFS